MSEEYNFHIEWIGTGAGLNPALGNTSFLAKGNGKRSLLVDCGSTVPLSLIELGKMSDVTDIVLTHTHADHIGGLEGLGFFNYFALNRREKDRPVLYVATDDFAHRLWENSLKGGMEKLTDEKQNPFDATIDTYFKVSVGKEFEIDGFPLTKLTETPHVKGLENYAIRFSNGVFYSGDTLELPPYDPNIIFQDCQFFEGGVHVSYGELKELPPEVREKIYLVHLGNGYDKKDPSTDGFAGFVMPGDKFDI